MVIECVHYRPIDCPKQTDSKYNEFEHLTCNDVPTKYHTSLHYPLQAPITKYSPRLRTWDPKL